MSAARSCERSQYLKAKPAKRVKVCPASVAHSMIATLHGLEGCGLIDIPPNAGAMQYSIGSFGVHIRRQLPPVPARPCDSQRSSLSASASADCSPTVPDDPSTGLGPLGGGNTAVTPTLVGGSTASTVPMLSLSAGDNGTASQTQDSQRLLEGDSQPLPDTLLYGPLGSADLPSDVDEPLLTLPY